MLHNGLFVKLLKKNVSVKFVRILHNWYSKLCASVQWNGIIGNVFPILCGVRQGGILSPMLFSIYVNDLLRVTVVWIWSISGLSVCWINILC